MYKVKRRLSGRRSKEAKAKQQQQQQQQQHQDNNSDASSVSGSASATQLHSILRRGQSSEQSSVASFPYPEDESSSHHTVGNNKQLGLNLSSPKRVAFASVHVREYDRALGDNPSCSSGAPVTIAWTYGKERKMHVEEFETSRQDLRRNQQQLILSRQDREELLLDCGATFQEIIDAIRTNVRVKHQRRRTINAIGTYDRWEEVIENAGRRIKRTLLMQPKSANSSGTTSQSSFKALQKPERRASDETQRRGSDERRGPSHTENCTVNKGSCSELKAAEAVNTAPSGADDDRHEQQHPRAGAVDAATQAVNAQRPTRAGSITQTGAPPETSASNDERQEPGSPPNKSSPEIHLDECDLSSMASVSFLEDISEDETTENGEDPGVQVLYSSGLRYMEQQRLQHQQPSASTLGYYGNATSMASNDYDDDGDDDDGDDNFESLQRDDSFWELRPGYENGPEIRRKTTPVIITEDDSYWEEQQGYLSEYRATAQPAYIAVGDVDNGQWNVDNMNNNNGPWEENGSWEPGFIMQPPPYSNAIISRWE